MVVAVVVTVVVLSRVLRGVWLLQQWLSTECGSGLIFSCIPLAIW